MELEYRYSTIGLPLSMLIGIMELVHRYCTQNLLMGTVRMKKEKDTDDEQMRKEVISA